MAKSEVRSKRRRELPDEDALRRAFDVSVEKRAKLEERGQLMSYWAGIADALGWVLGEYTDDPTK